MNKLSPPLLGFNNNVRHNGRVFHIQTEDSGIKYCRVVTHLFADGGRILRSNRTDYSNIKDAPDLPEQLRRLMKEQHRAMFVALRAGEYDQVINRTFDAAATIDIEPSSAPMSQPYQLRVGELPALSLPVPEGCNSGTPPAICVKRPSNRPKRVSSRAPAKKDTPAEGQRTSVPSPANDYGQSRDPSSSSTIPLNRPPLDSVERARYEPSRSLFGDSPPSEQSLGNVILSYVEDGTDKSRGHG